MAGIFAIDPATSTGWAFKATPVDEPLYGSVEIDGKSLGRFLFNFRRWQEAIMERLDPGIVYYEAPFIGNKGAVKKLYALQGQVELNCLDRGIIPTSVATHAWRSHFIGKGWRKQPRSELKRAVVKQCRLLGWKPANDDAADALGLLDYACGLEKWPPAPTGMFAGVT